MALFSFKQKNKSQPEGSIVSPDEILAYLDELVKKKINLAVSTSAKEVQAQIFFLEEKDGLMRTQGEGLTSMKGKTVSCGFSLDRSWFAFQSQVGSKDGKSYLTLPEEIQHSERRAKPRTAFSIREQVKVTILENLGSGSGVFGRAVDVSSDGMSLIIDRAMILDNEKEIGPGPGLYKPNCPLMLVKVNKIPGCAPFECQGTALRVYKDGKWKLAISFKKLPSVHQNQIEKFVDSRSIPFKLVKRSRRKREEEDTLQMPSNLDRDFAPSSQVEPEVSSEVLTSNSMPFQDEENRSDGIVDSDPMDIAGGTSADQNTNWNAASDEDLLEEENNTKPDDFLEPLEGEKPIVYSFGRELVPYLLFLKKRTIWHAESNFQTLVSRLNEKRPHAIFFSDNAAGDETLILIQKLKAIGLLEGVRVLWTHMESLNPKTHVKLRIAGVEKTLKLPVKDKAELLKTLLDCMN